MDKEELREELEMLTSIAFNNQNAYDWVQRALKRKGYEIDCDDIARAIESAAAEVVLELIVHQDDNS